MLNRVVMVSILCFVTALAPISSTQAEDSVDVTFSPVPGGGATVTIEADHSPADPATSAPDTAEARTAATRTCTFNDHDIPCTSGAGVWSQARECFVKRLAPQPDLTATEWNGHTDGTIYQCTPPGASFSAGVGSGYWFWAPDSGEDGAPSLVDPVTLAERAVDRMNLVAPSVGMTPLEPGAPTLVGVDTWLWIENSGQQAYGPITRTATAGPVSVTATATVTKVVWDMGDGTRVTCDSAGTPWTTDRGTGPSPDCGHRYLTPSDQEPNGTFTVRATAHWHVDWRGAGQSGQITFTMSGNRAVPVTELQVLQTG